MTSRSRPFFVLDRPKDPFLQTILLTQPANADTFAVVEFSAGTSDSQKCIGVRTYTEYQGNDKYRCKAIRALPNV